MLKPILFSPTSFITTTPIIEETLQVRHCWTNFKINVREGVIATIFNVLPYYRTSQLFVSVLQEHIETQTSLDHLGHFSRSSRPKPLTLRNRSFSFFNPLFFLFSLHRKCTYSFKSPLIINERSLSLDISEDLIDSLMVCLSLSNENTQLKI